MIELDSRSEGFGIFQIQDYDGAKIPPDFAISEAESVILHCEGKSIIVTVIEASPSGGFTGHMFAIEPPGAAINGLREGERIAFDEHHVFSMGK